MNFLVLVPTLGILLRTIACVEIISKRSEHYHPVIAQYQSKDGFGHYTYGYITPTSTKSESRGSDGAIKGGYSYLDPKGYLQTVKYIADPVHGFLVAASNLPQDVPSVANAKLRHLAAFEAIKAEHASLALSKQVPQLGLLPAVEDLSAAKYAAGPVHGFVPSNLPQDLPSVAYAKQRHLAAFEAIKAEHAALALSKQVPQVAVALPPPVKDLPSVARARAQHLAAFEAIKTRDLLLQADRAAADLESQKYSGFVKPYVPIIPVDGIENYSYGYIHPVATNGLHKISTRGLSYIDLNGDIKSINYLANRK